MKKSFLRGCLALALTLTSQGMTAQSAFSPTVNGLRSSYQVRRAASADAAQERGSFIVTCSMEASAAAIANEMAAMGAQVNALMGNQLIVTLPMSKLEEAAAIEGVLLIDLPGASTEKTDLTRKVSHVDEVHQGKAEGQQSLPQAYTGKGVIIGLIDSSYDFTHPIFKDKDGNLRIKGVYMASNETLKSDSEPLDNIPVTDDKGVTTNVSLPGSFITKADVILDTLKMKYPSGNHGTHCAAIAAGSIMSGVKGLGEAALGGMAPDADILLTDAAPSYEQLQASALGSKDLMSINRMQTLWLMQKYAKDQQKPLVVSWSQNNHDGFHDGTSTQARFVGQYCKAGNVMALCASNEGGDSMYIERKINQGKSIYINTFQEGSSAQIFGFAKTSKNIKVDLNVLDSERRTVYTCNLPLSVDGTKSYEHDFTYSVTANGNIKTWTYYDNYYGYNGPMEKLCNYIKQGQISLCIDKGVGLDINNQQTPYVRIEFSSYDLWLEKDPQSTDGFHYTFELKVTSPDEDVTMHAWGDYYSIAATSMEEEDRYRAGNSNHSIGDMNTSGEPVSIGAYAANIKQYNSKGELVESIYDEVGRYAYFSSYGYDLSSEQRRYPDVSTPGVCVLSANNSFASSDEKTWGDQTYENQFKGQDKPRNYNFVFASGTSMSTPAAAGIIALWIQAAKDKNKTLTNKDIKDIIAHSSETDEFTKTDPIRYGAGKMNAYKGLLYVLDITTAVPDLPTEHIGATLEGRMLHISGNPNVQVTIYNLAGHKVVDTQAVDGIVNLSSLSTGVYAVKIGTKGSTLIRL